jgi:hypothetical protein
MAFHFMELLLKNGAKRLKNNNSYGIFNTPYKNRKLLRNPNFSLGYELC